MATGHEMSAFTPFRVEQAATLREVARFLRLRPSAFRALLPVLVADYGFPKPIPCTEVFSPAALNEWLARQAGWLAGGSAGSADDGHSDPFLARERHRIEKATLRSNRPKA